MTKSPILQRDNKYVLQGTTAPCCLPPCLSQYTFPGTILDPALLPGTFITNACARVLRYRWARRGRGAKVESGKAGMEGGTVARSFPLTYF